MCVPTFTECKNILEDFYKQRKHFFISEIYIIQEDPVISAYSYVSDLHFTTYIKLKEDKFLISDLYKNLKPIITYALSYTRLRKFINYPNFILTEDNAIINYDYEYIDHELYVKDLKVILKTHYDFYDADYDLYFDVLAELENNNELIVSHRQEKRGSAAREEKYSAITLMHCQTELGWAWGLNNRLPGLKYCVIPTTLYQARLL